MNPVYLGGGILIVLAAPYSLVREGASIRSTAIAILAGTAFIIAGVERSIPDALTGSVLMFLWATIAIPERINRKTKHR